MAREKDRPFPYQALLFLFGSVALLGVGEAVILEINLGYFTSGYGGAYVDSLAMAALFFLAGALCDASLLLALWTLLAPTLELLGVPRLHVLPLTSVLALSVPVSMDFARYIVEALLGRITSLAALWELAGRSPMEMAEQAIDQVPALGWYAIFAATGAGAVALLARQLARLLPPADGFRPPRVQVLLLATIACGALASLVLALRASALEPIQFALVRKPSALLLTLVVDGASDFDSDGSGWLSRPPDLAPFDHTRHPFALEIPGNGTDENGLAGDLPFDFPAPAAIAPVRPNPAEGRPRAVLLILLESFRADLVGTRFQGKEVTPFLNRIAREGAHSERAYAHTPLTAESRKQLFQGRVAPRRGLPTLIDDFRALGYEIAYFSGQDDAFAESDVVLDPGRADRFYDARQDSGLRTGRGASRGALQVSWKLLARRVREYLAARDGSRPLFLYVNIVDTHFPYHHGEMDRIFDLEPISRHSISPARREQVWATYLNGAANVDRGIAEVVEAVRESVADPVVVITSDHGEALYEGGLLGHGRRLDDLGTRVPLLLLGVGGDWPEPLGLADLRGLLLQNLTEAPPARFTPEPGRTVLLCMPRVARPYLLGVRGLSGAVTYDFLSDRLEIVDADERAIDGDARAAFETLIRSWESVRLHERDGEP